MKTFRFILGVVMTLLLFTSCEKEPDAPKFEDKPGMVMLEEGKYVEATTEFTDEEALAVLKSKVWVTSYYEYVWYKDKIVPEFQREPNYFKFLENGIYKWAYYLNELNDDAPDFEYSVKNKKLTLHIMYKDIFGSIYSENISTFTLIAVDKDRIIFDGGGPSVINPDEIKTRFVLNAM